jgi:hypothetical protein
MATNCDIGIVGADGKITAVCCHFDGYPGGVGAALLRNHNSEDKARALIALGDLRSATGRVEAYHRDRGEPWENCAPIEYHSTALWGRYSAPTEFRYLWTRAGRWEYSERCPFTRAWGPWRVLECT